MSEKCTNLEEITLATLIKNSKRNSKTANEDIIDFKADYVPKSDFKMVKEYDVTVVKDDEDFNINLRFKKEKVYED